VRNKIIHRQKVQDREISDTRVSEISLSCIFAGVRFYMSVFDYRLHVNLLVSSNLSYHPRAPVFPPRSLVEFVLFNLINMKFRCVVLYRPLLFVYFCHYLVCPSLSVIQYRCLNWYFNLENCWWYVGCNELINSVKMAYYGNTLPQAADKTNN
jgi:hypothetical protein